MDAREQCLELAKAAVTQRADAYGKPEFLFARIAQRWSLTLGVQISARQVVLCMLDMKQERAIAGRQPDTPVDISGYGAILYEIDGADR